MKKDFAIILSWPDATIRGDEAWMMFFKKLGIVKNLNFKVGHTGIVLVNHKNGKMLFYDFGRYITPRGYGRARSENSDPLLTIELKATFKKGEISNLDEIMACFETMKQAMYGEGKTYFNVVDGISFKIAKTHADKWVNLGTYPYGAVARNNNNCSRFITRVLMEASDKYYFWHRINLPETIKASPMSNLVNTSDNNIIYLYEEGIKPVKMNRWQSLWFLIKQLGDNVFSSKAKNLPPDHKPGAMDFHTIPGSIPKGATYLGGVGDGAWYTVKPLTNKLFNIKRFTSSGKMEYSINGESEAEICANNPFEITYDSHYMHTHLMQNGEKIKVVHKRQEEHQIEVVKDDFPKEKYA